VFRVTVWAPDPGEPRARVTAVEIAFNDLLDDWPEVSVLLLEAALVYGKPLNLGLLAESA